MMVFYLKINDGFKVYVAVMDKFLRLLMYEQWSSNEKKTAVALGYTSFRNVQKCVLWNIKIQSVCRILLLYLFLLSEVPSFPYSSNKNLKSRAEFSEQAS